MLEIRPNCENCGKHLPNTNEDAMICTFECTFCKECVYTVLQNVCPNCGGGLEKRPSRPLELLIKYPASEKRIFKQVRPEKFKKLLKRYREVWPNKR
jgi:uncharacterized protein